VTLYCAYLAYSALVSEPHDYACNGVGRQLTAASASTLAAGAPPAARPRACLASAGGACVAYPAWASHLWHAQHGASHLYRAHCIVHDPLPEVNRLGDVTGAPTERRHETSTGRRPGRHVYATRRRPQ